MSLDESVRTYLGMPHNAATLKLYRNRGDSSFEDVTGQVGLDKVFMPMGSNFGDIDNDGFLDIYLGTGSPSYGSLVPNVLLRNRSGRTFVDVTVSSGTGELHKGHGVAFADLDHDGDLDMLMELGGSTPGDAHAVRLFENPGQGDWIGPLGAQKQIGRDRCRISVPVYPMGVHAFDFTGRRKRGSFGASPFHPAYAGPGKPASYHRTAISRWPRPIPRPSVCGSA